MRSDQTESDRPPSAHDFSSRQKIFLRSVLAGLRLLSSREKRTAAVLTVAIALNGIVEMASVACVLPFINVIIQPNSVHTNRVLRSLFINLHVESFDRFVVVFGMGVMLLMVFTTAFKWASVYRLHNYIASCQNRLTQDLLHECIYAPYSWFLGRNYATLSRLIYEDILVWSRSLVHRVMTMVENVVTVSAAVALVLVVSLWTGLLAMVVVGLVAFTVFFLTRPLLIHWASIKRRSVDTTVLAVTQITAGIRDIKLSARESYFTRSFQSAYLTMANAQAKANIWHATPSMAMTLLGQLALVAIALGLFLMDLDSGKIATQLALLIIVTTKMLPAVNSFSSSLGDLWNAFPYVEGIYGIRKSIAAEAQRVFVEHPPQGKVLSEWNQIAFHEVGFMYAGPSDWAMKGINVLLKRGGSYGVVGRSAAGKSTLVDLMVGLLQPTEGQILIDDSPLSHLELKSWQKQIGYVPQSPFIIDDSLRTNVAFGVPPNEVKDDRVVKCLQLAGLGTLTSGPGDGLDARVGDRGMRLSGGQRQRIAIARALYNAPAILVFDEATSALDTITEEEILKTLDNLKGHTTLVIIAHRMTTVAHCHEIFLLDEGKLVGQGSYDDLKANHPLFKKMVAGFKPEAGVSLAV